MSKLIGVTSFIKKFKKPFDVEAVSKRVAEKQGVTQREVLDDWDNKRQTSILKGNAIHKFVDQYVKNSKWEEPPAAYAPYCYNILNWIETHNVKIVKTEFKVVAMGLIGAIDAVAEIDGKLVLIDWKSSGNFTTENKFENFLEPISNLECTTYNEAALQLAIYAVMYEQLYNQSAEMKIVRVGDSSMTLAYEIPAIYKEYACLLLESIQ